MSNLGKAAIVCVGVALAIQVLRPSRTNPPVDPANAIAAHVSIPAPVQAIVTRACYDCHSNETRWPWYSGVAPISWFVIGHVNDGRLALNFSDWNAHRSGQPAPPLGKLCGEVQSGGMPLSTYLLMHDAAKLSDADKTTLCEWANAVGQTSPHAGSGK
jgi:hypothetical protein